MKIIMPEFVVPVLESQACDLLETCDIVVIDNQGQIEGDPEGAEVVMLPWALSQETVERLLGIPTLLARADFVVIAAPLTPETRGLIGTAELHRMREDAWLINIARGPIVDQAALIAALQEDVIAGAALDVFDEERLPADSPLWTLPNVILTPHNSWSTPHLKTREAQLFLDNLQRYLRDEPLRNLVDPSRGY